MGEETNAPLLPWYVITEEVSYTNAILEGGYGPTEYTRDVIEVEAATKRDAVSFGVKLMLELYKNGWCNQQKQDGLSPYSGVRAEKAICEHGTPHFCFADGRLEYVQCRQCEAEDSDDGE